MESDRYAVTRLSEVEFVSALKKGLGRAWLYVANHGLENVVNLVLQACVQNQSYDPQSESSRATWLFGMFGNSAYYSMFSKAILSALKVETDTWNLQQLSGLAKEMAVHGDAHAHQSLREFVFAKAARSANDEWLGADDWIELEGVDGVIELARIYGQRLMSDPTDYPYDCLFTMDETWQGYRELLLQYALQDERIKAYCEYLERQSVSSHPIDKEAARARARQRFRERYGLDQIIADAYNEVGHYPGHYTSFGRYAPPEELDKVYTLLLNETRDSVCVRLLWIFRRTALPRLSDRFFDWAVGGSAELRAAAIAALSQMQDGRVHQLARSKIQAGELLVEDSEALDLFFHNYEREDAQSIEQVLAFAKPETDEMAHSLGFSMTELAERHEDPGLANALKWVYENTPCAYCRHKVVALLDRFHQLNEALVYECLHDADEDTRALARERFGGKSPNSNPYPSAIHTT